MPATNDYTLIKLMRGGLGASEAWTPDEGEPLLDIETGTLRFGDNKTIGGTPINTVTSVQVPAPVNLNEQKIWGRYYIDGEVSNLPTGVESPGKFILVVEAADLGSAEVWQTLKIFSGKFESKTFVRSTTTAGIIWTDWSDISASGFSMSGSGTNNSITGGNGPETNLNKYIYSSNSFVENISSGPDNTTGGSGFLFTYRKDSDSPYIFQKLIMCTPDSEAGKVYIRFSVHGNADWMSPGYQWKEWTDYVNRDLLNATGILPTKNGGTGRNNGTIAQADQALKTFYSSS